MDNYIKIDKCIKRGLYRLNSRNLSFGVFKGEGFIGIRTKFGDVPQYYKDRNYAIVDVKYKDIDKLCKTFGISSEDGVIVYNDWLSSRPVYTRLKNSTNDSVLVPVL